MAPVKLTIRPRVQKDKWSLYWKTSMLTKTEYLDEFDLDVEDPSTFTSAQLKARVAEHFGWPPVDQLLRLEGFDEPWEQVTVKGVELPSDDTLEKCGVTEDTMIVAVRKVLVAEGCGTLPYVRSICNDECTVPEGVTLFFPHGHGGPAPPASQRGIFRH